MQKRAVCCDDRFIPALTRKANKIGEQGMRKRLAHQMIVNIFCLLFQFAENKRKFLHSHSARLPFVTVAKRAIHIAYISYFYVNLAVHSAAFPFS
jgi:hypothetical protein